MFNKRSISRRELIAGAASAAAMAMYGNVWADIGDGSGLRVPDNSTNIGLDTVPVAGSWRFIKNGPATALKPGQLPQLSFTDTINLPGTTDTNKIGPPSGEQDADSLTQPYRFVGPCWYEKQIEIPASWAQKRVSLVLERTRYTQVWLDGRSLGDNAIVCTPQEYDLGTGLSVGSHVLTIVVDNSRLPVNADAHMWSDNTQGNWNGIIGKMELVATDSVWLDHVQVFPDVANRRINIKLDVRSQMAVPGEGQIIVRAEGLGINGGTAASSKIQWSGDATPTEIFLELGASAALWDEFSPALHTLTVHLSGPSVNSVRTTSFGLREFKVHDKQFVINGRAVFLRGKHDACVFPLTGFAPMDITSWVQYFRILQCYGLNHVRFHTWTPPEAAFDAADRVGFYLQPELPYWGSWTEQVRGTLEPEAKRILNQLGNHPSFVMFSMGNEPWGGQDIIGELLTDLHGLDNRRLFVHGTGDGHPISTDDYTIAGDVALDWSHPSKSVRGANAGSPFDKGHAGHVQMGPANTMTDYSDSIASMPGPVISHEMGQYTVYPDYSQIAKYTGTCRPYNLVRYQKILSDAGMSAQAANFSRATGALAVICYREEIESCLRTPHHGGFELLDLVDYPGQGTALVGILDAFMDSKGIVSPEQWRRFCAPTVLLARFDKYAWTASETFAAEIQIAHYADRPLPGHQVDWAIVGGTGQTIASGKTPEIGATSDAGVTTLGSISVPLAAVNVPTQASLQIALSNSDVKTEYSIWVYPNETQITAPPTVVLAQSLDSKTRDRLLGGANVVLICDGSKPLAHSVGGAFAPDFWNFRFFYNKPGTMGLLCDPSHPALARFPTEYHSNWQWFGMSLHGQPLVLDGLVPVDYVPTVQVVDNYERCHKLGLVFEASVGRGKLLVCASDLISQGATDPAAKQLLSSLLTYAASGQFNPKVTIGPEQIESLLRTTVPTDGCTATASSTEPDWRGYYASQLIDGNEARGWHAAANATGDSWCQIHFADHVSVTGMEVLWDQEAPGYKYQIEASTDGTTWYTASDQSNNAFTGARQEVSFSANGVSDIKVVISAVPNNRPPAIMELRFFAPMN